MSSELVGLLGIVALLSLIFLRAPIGIAMLIAGVGGIWYMEGWRTVVFISSTAPVRTLTSETLSVLPLFLLMGNFALHSGMASSIYKAANALVGHLRGGLAAGTILASAGFGAICGSSLATVSTMARISGPEMLRYGYNVRLVAGSVGAGGTLGILIPPSLLMILYAFVTETSVGRMFAAGLVPGLIAVSLYCVAIFIWVLREPEIAPSQKRARLAEQLKTLGEVLGPLLVFAIVMGGIFAGFFTPTEGAAVGAFSIMVIGLVMRQLDLAGLWKSIRESVMITGMIFLLIIGIDYFNFFMEISRLPDLIEGFLLGLDYPPIVVMIIMILILMVLGCFLDAVAIVLIMTPFLYPVVVALGYDLVWFGIVLVMVVEIGLLTPPFGMNVFLINALLPQISLKQAFLGVAPFIAADIVRISILVAFPVLTLWLPNLIFG